MKFIRIGNVRIFEWCFVSILRCLQNKEEKGQKGQLSEFWVFRSPVFNYEVPVCSTPFSLFGMLILSAFLSALSVCPSPSLDCAVFVLSKWSLAYHRTVWLSCLRPSLEPLWLFEFPCITILHSFPFEYWIPISNISNSKHLFLSSYLQSDYCLSCISLHSLYSSVAGWPLLHFRSKYSCILCKEWA